VNVATGMPTAEAIAANLTSVLADIQAPSEGGTSSLSKRSSSRRKHHLVQDSENEYLSNSAGIALPENGIRDDLTFGMLFGENLASNIILINGNLTASKKGALIGNDPHMSAESPGFYWLGSMRSEESGFEASGLFAYCSSWPVSGRNKHHSWGITSSMADSVDLYVMVDVPLNSSNPTGPKGYLYNGTVLSYVERIEIIQVFDLNTQTMTQSTYKVLETVYGPVVNTLYGLPGNAPKISMRMTSIASEGVHSYNYIAQLASNAENWEEFRDGIK
jgi:penicillin amidase